MANQSVLELAVGTGKWDAGLKKAKSALDNFTQASGGLQAALNKDSDKMQQFVRMMGNVDSTAKTAKGQMNDYKSVIEQLTMQYNRMSEAQKETIGQDYLQAIEQQKQKYQALNDEIKEMNRSLNEVKVPDSIAEGGGGMFGGLGDKMSGALQVFAGNMMTKAVGAVTNLGSELMETAKQSVELAKQGEGVRLAFERLNQPGLLANLKEATHGTVSEMELMKQAIKFDNFKLPLEDLSTYLAFAQQKAKDTGESIDYLVDSIVTGLGRQSKQILDNLGISASELTRRMSEGADMTTAVADIIREEMAKAGDYIETAADRAARASADATNQMEELGRKAIPVAEEWANVWNEIKIGGLSVLTTVLGPIAESIRDIRELLSGEYELKIKANIPNLADGPQPLPNKAPGTDHKVIAPGGYVQVTDRNTGAVIGGKHFDDLQDSNSIKEWQRGLFKNGGGRGNKKNNLPEYDDFAKQSAKSMLNTDELKKGAEMLSPYQMMLPEIKKNILDIKDADLGGALAKLGDKEVREQIDNMIKSLGQEKMAFGLAGQAAENFGAALAGMDDPAAKAAGTVISAIANIALGFATASTQAGALGPFGWIAWLVAGTAALATTISTVHSLTGYAEGGMIKGNSYSGDRIGGLVDGNQLVGLNAGEIVLNKAAQGNLASQLQEGGMRNINLSGRVVGEDIFLSADRYSRRSGRGALLTGKNL